MAYRQIYDKNPVGDNIGKYRGLDFQYLKELSAIDMHFRFLIIKMCLDIEHYLKIDLLNKAEKRGDNGYEGVDLFFQNTQAERIKHNIYGKRFSPYCSDLINYCFEFDEDNNSISSYEKCRIWDLLECLTFGEFLIFYEFYHQQYKIHNKYIKIINSVINKTTQKTTQKVKLNDNQQKIVDLINDNPFITRNELASKLDITPDGVKYNLNKLTKNNVIERIGPDNGGYWKVNI